jgi:hypothetical protein
MPDDNCRYVGLSGFRTAIRIYLDLYSSERKDVLAADDFRRILRIWDENTYEVTAAILSARKALRATGYPVPDDWRVRPVRPDVGIIEKDADGFRVIRTTAIPALARKRFRRIADAVEKAMGRIEDGEESIALEAYSAAKPASKPKPKPATGGKPTREPGRPVGPQKDKLGEAVNRMYRDGDVQLSAAGRLNVGDLLRQYLEDLPRTTNAEQLRGRLRRHPSFKGLSRAQPTGRK